MPLNSLKNLKKKDKELRKKQESVNQTGQKKMLNCVNIIKSYVSDL